MGLARLPQDDRAALAKTVKSQGYRAVSTATGLTHQTIRRALSGGLLAQKTHAAVKSLARQPAKVLTSQDFAGALRRAARRAPQRTNGAYSWPLETIRAARDAQLAGRFAVPVKLAEAMRTDDAIFVARRNRIAAQYALATKLAAHESARGAAVASRCAASVTVTPDVLTGIHGTLADHGVAIGHVERTPTADGTRVDMRLTEWPLEHVVYDSAREVLTTNARDETGRIDITHGDGEWIIFRKSADKPWTQEACLLPGALLWAAHTGALADWAGGSRAHGDPKVTGELPEGFALLDADGELTPEATAFLALLVDIVAGEAPAGLIPPGAKANFMAGSSNAWQIFVELVENREKAAARIYLGTDAILGTVGGAPGIDISALFAVASTLLQSDLLAIQTGLKTGLYEPWTAINEGDTRLAPHLEYVLPDPDADARQAEQAAKRTRLHTLIGEMREQKLEVTQADVDRLAAELGVSPTPRLASVENQTSTIVLAPTDVAKVVRVREARAAQGLQPFGTPENPDPRDDLTLTELEAKTQAKAEAAKAQAEAAAQADADAKVKAAPEAPSPTEPTAPTAPPEPTP